jgi:hypothetical protein
MRSNRKMFVSFRLPSCQAAGLVRIGTLAAVSLLSGPAIAADLIGTVYRGNHPAPGVTVSLETAGAVSDANGRFVIRNLRPGDYSLRCGKSAPIQVKIKDGLNEVRCQAQ